MTGERRLAYRLALALSEPMPDRMLEMIPFRVWKEWVIYMGLEPFGETRADLRIGVLSSLFANAWMRKRGSPMYGPTDFMPYLQELSRTETKTPLGTATTPDEMFALIKVVNKEAGGKEISLR